MAAGGTFLTYNKVLPGAYINFISKARALGTMGERGTAAFLWKTDWGNSGEIITIESGDFEKDSLEIFGYSYDDDKVMNIREVFKGADTIKIMPAGTVNKASASLGTSLIEAKCAGSRGNRIMVKSEENVDGGWTVSTYMEDVLFDEQSVSTAEELEDNSLICFKTRGELTASAGIYLEGGTDAEISGKDYSDFIDKIEAEDFTTVIYDGSDDVTKGLFASFTKRMRDEEGVKITCVLSDYTKADYEGVISVKNTVDGDNPCAIVYWVGGKNAGAEVNESLTNSLYDGEYSINADFKKSELKSLIQDGQFVIYKDRDDYRVLKDINSFTSFETNKNSDFSNNQIVRVLDSVANDTAKIFNTYYLGKAQNDELGRSVFKAELIKYHEELQAIGAITNFTSEDIEVSKGTEKGDVIVKEYIEPVAAMDKLYMSCIVE